MNSHQDSEILIVEDSRTQAEYLKAMLQTQGYAVRHALNGQEALSLIRQRPPSLIISDILMPTMDGYMMCRQLKQEEELARIPVVLLTSLSEPEAIIQGLECGADGFIIKPYDEELVLRRIAHLLMHRKLRESGEVEMNLEVLLGGKRYVINTDKQQILTLLISTFESAVQQNRELIRTQGELTALAEQLEARVAERTKALQASEAKYRDLLASTADAILVVGGDKRLRYVNAAAEMLFGCPASKLFSEEFDFPLGTGGTPEVEIRRPAGDLVVAEVRVVQSQWEGEAVHLVSLRDMTERKHAENILRENERWVRLVVDNIPIPISYMDRELKYRFVNRPTEKWFGMSAAEIQGRHLVEITGEPAYRILKPYIESVLSGQEVSFETSIPYLHGGTRQVSVKCVPHFDHDGMVQGFFAVTEDVSEQKRLEARLRQSQRLEAIGTLAGGIAHDFNNILAAIMGYAELAFNAVSPDSKVRGDLQQVLTASKRAKDLVQHILAFSRQSEPVRRPVQLAMLVKEVLRLVRVSLPANIEIQQRIHQEVGAVVGDASQMHQVLLNLCTNAEHAMRDAGGVLEVEVERFEVDATVCEAHPGLMPGPHVRLRVRDTGHGMEPTVLEHIFEPFFTTKEPGVGTGMGLAMVHGIISDHGGAITVESTPGAGSTFEVYLPRLEETANSVVSQEEVVPSGKGHILLVDDEVALVRLGQEMLQQLGYEVTAQTSSMEALEAFRTDPQRFDLVITDQAMPHMTGEVLTRELRRMRPDIPIILCTGFSHVMTPQKVQALGLNAMLMKPLTIRELGLAVWRICESQTEKER